MTGQVLVAGIGNIFLGDDGFGVAVATRLARAGVPDGVRVVDYGIRGMHLAYDLANGFDAAILIDASPRGGTPGTLYVIEPDLAAPAADPAPAGSPLFDAHGMQPDVVFGMLDMLGGARPGRILIVGCEPASVDYGIGLSDAVAASVDEAVRVVAELAANGGAGWAADHQAIVTGDGGDGQSELSTEERAHVPRHSR